MRSMPFLLSPLLASLCLISLTAHAQTKDAPKPAATATPATSPATSPAPVAAAPERTTASFGDWILRCEGIAAPAKRVCEVAQIITLQGQTNPVAQLALGRAAPNEPMRLTIVLPTNVAIPAKPQLLTAKPGGTAFELTWQSCTSAGCFASAEVNDEAIAGFGAQTEPGRMLFKDAAGREAALPLSFRGLTQAVAALAKEKEM